VAVDLNKWLSEHTLNVPDTHFDDTGAAVLNKR